MNLRLRAMLGVVHPLGTVVELLFVALFRHSNVPDELSKPLFNQQCWFYQAILVPLRLNRLNIARINRSSASRDYLESKLSGNRAERMRFVSHLVFPCVPLRIVERLSPTPPRQWETVSRRQSLPILLS